MCIRDRDNIAEGKLQGFLAFDPGSAFVGLLVGCVFVFIIDNKWLNAAITNVVALAPVSYTHLYNRYYLLRLAMLVHKWGSKA